MRSWKLSKLMPRRRGWVLNILLQLFRNWSGKIYYYHTTLSGRRPPQQNINFSIIYFFCHSRTENLNNIPFLWLYTGKKSNKMLSNNKLISSLSTLSSCLANKSMWIAACKYLWHAQYFLCLYSSKFFHLNIYSVFKSASIAFFYFQHLLPTPSCFVHNNDVT